MNITTIAAFIGGLLVTQCLPLPKWRLLAGLIALGMMITGGDLLAVLNLPQHVISPSIVWMRLGSGLLTGCGLGYFLSWIRFAFVQWMASQHKD